MRYEEVKFRNIVKEGYNISDVTKKLGLRPTKGNRDTVKKYIFIYNLDVSHFTFEFPGTKNIKNKKNISEILIENSTHSRRHLKERLIKEGIKENICEMCGQNDNWHGKKMSMILDHINGIPNDNRLENLRIICPNCNYTLETTGSKNKSKYTFSKIEYKCIDCESIISSKSKRCIKCNHIKSRKSKRPEFNVLITEINEIGYVKTGEKYGVSDNSIKKWIKAGLA